MVTENKKMSGTVVVALHQCRNLRCARGYPFVIIARIEFGSKMLGESNRLECNNGEPFDIGFNTVLNCSEPQTLDEMAQYPLLVTLLEVLPKDKKAKEEKMQVLGQTCVDLLPLLMGELSLQVSQTLLPEQEDNGLHDTEVDIKVSVSQPLLQEKLLSQSNLLTLGVRSLYSLPDSWQPSSFPYTMTLATPIPTSSQRLRSVLVPNGHLKLPSEPEPDQWRWPSMPNVVGKATLIPGGVEQLALEDESGDLNKSNDVQFRRTAECNKPRIAWTTRHRCRLPPEASSSLLQELSKCPLWPVEVCRYSSPGVGGGKVKVKEEEVTMSFHGVAYINLAPLLYPGATKVCGAYLLQPYNEVDINQKLQRTHTTLLEPVTRSPTSLGKKAPGAGKRVASSSRITDSTSAVEEVAMEPAEMKTEGHAYLDARSYIHLEITLHKPLIPKRPASVLAEKISEYIPPRPALPKQVGGVDKAIQDFHDQTANIADLLLHEYRDMFGEELANGSTKEAADNRRHRLLYQLNSSGKYYSFKEQLKLAVVKVVREKFLNQAKFEDQSQQQAFLSQLYVFLTDEMHTGLGKVFALDAPPPPPPTILTCDMLRDFASEAEVLEDFKMAEYYYKERLSRANHIASYWYDYGVFCLLTSDLDRSQQCFKEALALDQHMVPVLLMYGMMCSLDGRHSEGESFFDMATTIDPTNIIAWTMRGLFYEHSNNPMYRDMAYQEATKLSLGEQEKTYISHGRRLPGTQSKVLLNTKLPPHMGVIQHPSPSGTVTSGADGQALVQKSKLWGAEGSTVRLQDHGTPLTPSKVLPGETAADGSQEQHKPVASSSVNLHETASISSEGKASQGKPAAATAGEVGGGQQTGGVVAPGGQQTGGVVAPGEQPKAEGSRSTHKLGSISETSLDLKGGTEGREEGGDAEQAVSIFLQTAAYLLDVHALKFAEMCLGHELTSPCGGPSPHYHIAVARLHTHRHDYTKAIECLRTAIVLDIQDSNAWALMGHAHYLTGAYADAKDAYERAVNYPTPPAHLHAVYLRLADTYMRDGEYHKAKDTYLHACRKSPSCVSWRGVGIASYKLGRLDEAEDALGEANILNNLDPVVWAYLALVCLRTGRQVEAEQSLKYAIKVGLNDTALLNEINLLQRKSTTPHVI